MGDAKDAAAEAGCGAGIWSVIRQREVVRMASGRALRDDPLEEPYRLFESI